MDTNTLLLRLALHCQGLTRRQPFGKGLVATRRAIEHLGYVQIDTIAVIARAHHHILWTRAHDYQADHLNTLIRQGHIFEHWAHAAAYLPMRDYRFATVRMQRIRASKHPWFDVNETLAQQLLHRIRSEGALTLRGISKTGKKSDGNWWNWGDERRALDKLFLQGDLMIAARNGMEKTYDLTERLLPAHADTRTPDRHEYAVWLLDSHLRAHGVVTLAQILHLQNDKALKNTMRELIAARLHTGSLQSVAGQRDTYVHGEWSAPRKGQTLLHILSPFDNLVIHRARLQQLFGFDYRLECYLPKGKRQHGYFVLPVLYGERFIGRMDCKAHREARRLEIHSFTLEERAPPREEIAPPLRDALHAFAAFNGCTDIDTGKNNAWINKK